MKIKRKVNIRLIIIQLLVTLLLSLYIGGILGELLGQIKTFQYDPNHKTEKSDIVINFDIPSVADGLSGKNGIISSVALFTLLNLGIYMIKQRAGKFSGGLKDERNFTYADSGVYGTSLWMTKKERAAVLHELEGLGDNSEIILGRTENNHILTIPDNSMLNKHIAVFGASGTGKSRAFARNYILQCVRRNESLIMTDPKGELYKTHAAQLRARGYTVKVFNLVNLVNSDSWNPLLEIGGIDPTTMAQVLADVIIQNTSSGKSSGDFWSQCEMNLCKALCLYVRQMPGYEGNRTMKQVYKLLTSKNSVELDAMFDMVEPNDDTEAMLMAYNIFKQASDSVKGGVIIGLGSRLQIFQGNAVGKITSSDEIDLTAPGKTKCAYFCITSDQHSAFDFLAVLFYSMLFIKLVEYADSQPSAKCAVPVNFVLDEFPNIGAIPDFCKKISTIRSRSLNVAVIFQNIAQLQNRYPFGTWEEILGNCDTHLFLGCADPTTAKFISTKTGIATVLVSSAKQDRTMLSPLGDADYSRTYSTGKRNLLTDDEVAKVPRDEEIIFIRGQNPLRAFKYDYSLHPDVHELVDESAVKHIPHWRQTEIDTQSDVSTEAQACEAAAEAENSERAAELRSGVTPAPTGGKKNSGSGSKKPAGF